jgi:hypothetical protein
MAKAKKTASESPDNTKPRTKAAAPKEVKGAAKAAPAKAPPPRPLIDASLAAQAAARMLVNRPASSAPRGDANRKPSSTFKQMKDSLDQGHGAGVDSFLDSTASPAAKKSNLPFGQSKQVGHNQTFGADVNRRNVPRRTGG